MLPAVTGPCQRMLADAGALFFILTRQWFLVESLFPVAQRRWNCYIHNAKELWKKMELHCLVVKSMGALV